VWFAGVLRDPLQHCFLAVDAEDRPVGQLRFAREGREATLSINVAPAERGKGYGKALVLAGARTLFRTTDTEVIHALVKTENAASSELFARAGFHREPPKEVDGHPALHFTLRRDMLAP
jgi:RimJ/RimL family protein N-acetyltransferase